MLLLGRVLLQELLNENRGWDEQVPEAIAERWRTWLSSLPLLRRLHVHRYRLQVLSGSEFDLPTWTSGPKSLYLPEDRWSRSNLDLTDLDNDPEVNKDDAPSVTPPQKPCRARGCGLLRPVSS